MKLTKERGRQLRDIWHDIVWHYGASSFQDNTVDLNLYYQPASKTYGECEWDGTEVSINVGICRTVREAVETMIEEYMHYCQSPSWYTRYYNMGHTYWTHPYELQAKAIAKRDAHLFLAREP